MESDFFSSNLYHFLFPIFEAMGKLYLDNK